MEVMNGDMQARPISKVLNCNCLEYMRTLPDKCFDLCIADPPYGGAGNDNEIRNSRGRFEKYKNIDCSRTGGTWAAKYGTNINEWDVAPTQDFFDEIQRVSKNQIIWGANYFTMPPTRCFVIWKKHIPDNFTMSMCEYAWTSFNANAKLFECPSLGKKEDPRTHPTQKPIKLYAWLLQHFAKEGDTIFDPMMGSGSSRIAAYKLGFDFTGCEINKDYFDKSCQRFDKLCHGITKDTHNNTITQLKIF